MTQPRLHATISAWRTLEIELMLGMPKKNLNPAQASAITRHCKLIGSDARVPLDRDNHLSIPLIIPRDSYIKIRTRFLMLLQESHSAISNAFYHERCKVARWYLLFDETKMSDWRILQSSYLLDISNEDTSWSRWKKSSGWRSIWQEKETKSPSGVKFCYKASYRLIFPFKSLL